MKLFESLAETSLKRVNDHWIFFPHSRWGSGYKILREEDYFRIRGLNNRFTTLLFVFSFIFIVLASTMKTNILSAMGWKGWEFWILILSFGFLLILIYELRVRILTHDLEKTSERLTRWEVRRKMAFALPDWLNWFFEIFCFFGVVGNILFVISKPATWLRGLGGMIFFGFLLVRNSYMLYIRYRYGSSQEDPSEEKLPESK